MLDDCGGFRFVIVDHVAKSAILRLDIALAIPIVQPASPKPKILPDSVPARLRVLQSNLRTSAKIKNRTGAKTARAATARCRASRRAKDGWVTDVRADGGSSFTSGLDHWSEESTAGRPSDLDLRRLSPGQNLGPVADAGGRIDIQICDFDQAVIGNPAYDLIRLALSLATAARGSDLPGVSTALMMEEMIVGYEGSAALSRRRNPSHPGKDTEPIRFVLKQALKRKWRHLAEERIEDVKPSIPLGKCFWTLTGSEKREISRLFGSEDVRRLITSLRSSEEQELRRGSGCLLLDEGVQLAWQTPLRGAGRN